MINVIAIVIACIAVVVSLVYLCVYVVIKRIGEIDFGLDFSHDNITPMSEHEHEIIEK